MHNPEWPQPAPDEDEQLANQRIPVRIPGPMEVFMVIPFSLAEVVDRQERGLPTPLDMMPCEYWSPAELPFPRFGEEMLGSDF